MSFNGINGNLQNFGRTRHKRAAASEETKLKMSKARLGAKHSSRKKGDERTDAEKEGAVKSANTRRGVKQPSRKVK